MPKSLIADIYSGYKEAAVEPAKDTKIPSTTQNADELAAGTEAAPAASEEGAV
jgi:hypothetical protein